MATKTLKEISMLHAQAQPKQVEFLTEGAPILDSVPFEASTHGTWNLYEELTDIIGATLVKMDGVLPKIDVSSDLKKTELEFFGGKIERGEDAVAEFGSFAAYLAMKEQPIFKKFGMDAEQRMLYQYLRLAAIAGNNVKDQTVFDAGGTNNTNYSILIVRWEPGVCTGLYNPKGFSQGAMLSYKPYNNGSLYENANGVGVYGGRYKSQFGFQIASPMNVALIANIDRQDADPTNWKLPTATMIDDAIAAVRGTSGDTRIYCRREVVTALGKFKEDRLQTNVQDKNFSRSISTWDGLPIVDSYNFLKASEQNLII